MLLFELADQIGRALRAAGRGAEFSLDQLREIGRKLIRIITAEEPRLCVKPRFVWREVAPGKIEGLSLNLLGIRKQLHALDQRGNDQHTPKQNDCAPAQGLPPRIEKRFDGFTSKHQCYRWKHPQGHPEVLEGSGVKQSDRQSKRHDGPGHDQRKRRKASLHCKPQRRDRHQSGQAQLGNQGRQHFDIL